MDTNDSQEALKDLFRIKKQLDLISENIKTSNEENSRIVFRYIQSRIENENIIDSSCALANSIAFLYEIIKKSLGERFAENNLKTILLIICRGSTKFTEEISKIEIKESGDILK